MWAARGARPGRGGRRAGQRRAAVVAQHRTPAKGRMACGAQGFLRALAADGDISQVCMNYGQYGGMGQATGIPWASPSSIVARRSCASMALRAGSTSKRSSAVATCPENNSWAQQTVAHNCVTVDGQTQSGADHDRADAVHGLPHFFVGSGPLQAMSAFANDHYPGVGMQRTVVLIEHQALGSPVLVDLFRLASEAEHEYDTSCSIRAALRHHRAVRIQRIAMVGARYGQRLPAPHGRSSGQPCRTIAAHLAAGQPFQ